MEAAVFHLSDKNVNQEMSTYRERMLLRVCGLCSLLLVTACAGTGRTPEKEAGTPAKSVPAPSAQAAGKPAVASQPSSVPPAPPEPRPAPSVTTTAEVLATRPPQPAAQPENAKRESAAAKPKPATAAPVAPVTKAAPAPKPPALDLAALEKRLKETSAIGVMTKLTLKNQVDDLLDRFKAYYDGRAKTTLAQLRQPYDLLIMKVLSALQDSDPSLAKAVADSREAIWAILSDPDKFRSL